MITFSLFSSVSAWSKKLPNFAVAHVDLTWDLGHDVSCTAWRIDVNHVGGLDIRPSSLYIEKINPGFTSRNLTLVRMIVTTRAGTRGYNSCVELPVSEIRKWKRLSHGQPVCNFWLFAKILIARINCHNLKQLGLLTTNEVEWVLIVVNLWTIELNGFDQTMLRKR